MLNEYQYKPHFRGPLPTAQACLLPQQHPQQPLPAPAARCPGLVAVGIGISATPGNGQARKKGLIGHGGPETEKLTGRCWATTTSHGARRKRHPYWNKRTVSLPLDALRNGVAGDG